MLGRAVLALCIFSGTALADLGQLCFDGHAVVPSDGSIDVPLNAKAWIAKPLPGEYRLASAAGERSLRAISHHGGVLELPLGPLQAETSYELRLDEELISRFSTGSTFDVEAPEPPEIFGSDIRMIKPGRDAVVTASSDGISCMTTKTHAGDDCVHARSIDVAGNVSRAVTVCGQRAAATAALDPPSDDSHGVAIAFALMGLCGFAFSITRANAVRRTFATSKHMIETDIEVMHGVARAQRRRTAVFAAVCALSMFALASLPIEIEPRIVLTVTPAMLLTVAVVALCRLQLLLGLRREAFMRVLSHGDYMFVARGKRLVGWVAAPPKLVAQASALPVATLRA